MNAGAGRVSESGDRFYHQQEGVFRFGKTTRLEI